MHKDFSGDHIFVFQLSERSYRFFPVDIELVTAFIETQRERLDKLEKMRCGAV